MVTTPEKHARIYRHSKRYLLGLPSVFGTPASPLPSAAGDADKKVA
jgi:hypothetical protein